jgi:hypothetical protein
MTKPDPITAAITALTAAARATRMRGTGTPEEQREPADFGDIACHVLTTVAANVGGVDALLAGRPGSWEADLVRQIVLSTAGDDERELLRWRTEPVRLTLDVEDAFYDFGLVDLYESDTESLALVEETGEETLFEAVATDAERAQLAAIDESMPPLTSDEWETDRERIIALVVRARTIVQGIITRATQNGHPAAAALSEARRARELVDGLWKSDQASYVEAYTATVRRTLTELGVSEDVELRIDTPDASETSSEPEWWDELEHTLHDVARAQTPLPMSGAAPDWTDGTPADALRRASLTYVARADNTPASSAGREKARS